MEKLKLSDLRSEADARPKKENIVTVALTDQQQATLNAMVEETGLSRSEIVRKSLDFFFLSIEPEAV